MSIGVINGVHPHGAIDALGNLKQPIPVDIAEKLGIDRRRMIMALDKAIEHGKEKRKPYNGSKAIDCTCRNHGTCKWCEENRKHKFRDKRPVEPKEDT
jgi:hypothetical protein